MYVRTGQFARHRGSQKALGDLLPTSAQWASIWDAIKGNEGGVNVWAGSAAPSPVAAAVRSNSTVLDSLNNLFRNVTGTTLTPNQAAQSAAECVQSIQNMRARYPANVSAGAEQKCYSDQAAYLNLVNSQNILDSTTAGIPTWLLLLVAAGGIYLLVR